MDWQAIDPRVLWGSLAFVGLLIVVGLVFAARRSRKTAHLRGQFGSEYDRLATNGKRSAVERELLDRERKVGELDIRPVSASDRTRLRAEWEHVQARFVERPTTAVVEAEELISNAMQLRGYPPADFERRAADLSVHYPRLVGDYREAHRLLESHRRGALSTEDLRRAMILQRRLFDELVGGGASDVVNEVPVERETDLDVDRRERDRRIAEERDEQRV